MKIFKRVTIAVGISLIVLLLIYAALAAVVYSNTGRFPTEGARYPSPRITRILWPTIGCPSMLAAGESIQAEIDLGDGTGGQPEGVSGFRAAMEASREELSGLAYGLMPEEAWRAPSDRWPKNSRRGRTSDLWHVRFRVPREAVPELYDLVVEADVGGGAISDRQRHAISVVEKPDETLEFVSISDVHVHRRNISGFMQRQTDKGISLSGKPVYFYDAIDQINLIRPDFVLMLGDFVRAQHEPGDYQVEFEEFYEALLTFEVPVFAVPGNHDQYVNEVDGARVWEENLGPLYYSFDASGCHFTCVNSYQWPAGDRIVMKKFGAFAYPRKWQGQILWAKDEMDDATYTGQLGWIREDLKSNEKSGVRFIAMHHGPYLPDGKGSSFQNQRFAGVFSLGGGGSGREAIGKLAADRRVEMVLSGHEHTDRVGFSGGTTYAQQTCLYFDEGGSREMYPGYRYVTVDGGRITGYAYLDGVHSYPFYDGSVLEGKTDIDGLDRPAIESKRLSGSGGGSGFAWELTSYLGVPMEVSGLARIVEYAPNGYRIENGEVYRAVGLPGGEEALLYLRAQLDAGVPGQSASRPGEPARVTVTISPN